MVVAVAGGGVAVGSTESLRLEFSLHFFLAGPAADEEDREGAFWARSAAPFLKTFWSHFFLSETSIDESASSLA